MNPLILMVKASINAMHLWPDAPEHRIYLRNPHRHTFMITVHVPVREADRELEFHDLQEKLERVLKAIAVKDNAGQWTFGSMSCEHIGQKILGRFPETVAVFVAEDDLHAAMVQRENKRKVVTVCGSTKFKEEALKAIAMLEERGDMVLSVGSFMHADKIPITQRAKQEFDELHKDKIRSSDYIYVVNPGIYIGESTHAEIQLAKELGLPIEYMFTIEDMAARPAVIAFTQDMEAKLRANDHKNGWADIGLTKLFELLNGEVDELTEALEEDDARNVINECADVANYAMMIADIIRRGCPE